MLSRIISTRSRTENSGCFAEFDGNRDDKSVDEGETAPHEIFVTASDGIEAASVDRDRHVLVGNGTWWQIRSGKS